MSPSAPPATSGSVSTELRIRKNSNYSKINFFGSNSISKSSQTYYLASREISSECGQDSAVLSR